MKITKKLTTYLCCATLAASCSLFTSCNFLDVVPPEQADLEDATANKEKTLGFLFSCYAGINAYCPYNYSGYDASTDEFVVPALWSESGQKIAYGLNTPTNVVDGWMWGNSIYRYIGQCYLFKQQLPGALEVSEEEKVKWAAEADFLIAYYHMVALVLYGPCPIATEYIDMDSDTDTYPGRSHYDYCVDWICNKFDEVAQILDTQYQSGEDFGRATSVMAKAMKARLLVYAASPLWNGSFPYKEWRNKNYETPGYGKELVSHTYSREKWERAQTACQEALDLAIASGNKLMQLPDAQSLIEKQEIPLPYVPFKNLGGADEAAEKQFKEYVLLMRYITTTRYSDGNREMIFPTSNNGNYIAGSMPHRIIQNNTGGWRNWYSGVSPTLNTVENFYTENGKLPAKDPDFYEEDEWFERAGATGSEALRGDIIKLNTRREPRFYAWIAFDGGDYGSRAKGGKPIVMDLKNSKSHGYDPVTFVRDNCVTGYLNQKFVEPRYEINAASITQTTSQKCIMRMAELYLNLAECQAALGDNAGALQNLNIIRRRAGVPELTTSDITSDMSMTDWVRTEREIELWAEGHRYHDVRRWVIAPQVLGSGVRYGLNAIEKTDPTFEEFNKPVKVNQNYKWYDRMYVLPVFYNEVYKNPQMVQAPGY